MVFGIVLTPATRPTSSLKWRAGPTSTEDSASTPLREQDIMAEPPFPRRRGRRLEQGQADKKCPPGGGCAPRVTLDRYHFISISRQSRPVRSATPIHRCLTSLSNEVRLSGTDFALEGTSKEHQRER